MLSAIPRKISSGRCFRAHPPPPAAASSAALGSTLCSGRNQKYLPQRDLASLSLWIFQICTRIATTRPMAWTMKMPPTLVRGRGTGAAVEAAAALRTERATQGARKEENWVLNTSRCGWGWVDVGTCGYVRGSSAGDGLARGAAGTTTCCTRKEERGARLVGAADDGGGDKGAHRVNLLPAQVLPEREGVEACGQGTDTRGRTRGGVGQPSWRLITGGCGGSLERCARRGCAGWAHPSRSGTRQSRARTASPPGRRCPGC